MTLYANLVALLVGGATIAWIWLTPSPLAWLLLATTGLIAGLAADAMTQAFRIASPAALAPFDD